MLLHNMASVGRVGLLSSLLVGLLTGCATPTEAECDPSDDAILKAFTCRDQYQNRQDKLQEEVRVAADRAVQKEQELAELEGRREAMSQQLAVLQQDLNAREQRISALRSEQGVNQQQLAQLQDKWEQVKQETDALVARQSEVQVVAQVNEFDEQLAELRKEEAELEALLLDLES